MLTFGPNSPQPWRKKPTDGLSLFYTDVDRSKIEITEIDKTGRKAIDINQVFIDGLKVPLEDRIGEEGKGLHYLLHGANPGASCTEPKGPCPMTAASARS